MRDARREIERDERRIDLEMRKDRIVDRNSREGIDMMVNAPTRRTDYVPCEIRHFVGKVRIQGLHVGKIRREGFLSLDKSSSRSFNLRHIKKNGQIGVPLFSQCGNFFRLRADHASRQCH
jgi:hypothetical protein